MQNRPTWIGEVSESEVRLRLDATLYPLDIVTRVAYGFTDRCFVYLAPVEGADDVDVFLTAKSGPADMEAIAGEFANSLVDQHVRRFIAAETRAIRDLVAAQAFAEADLLDRSGVDSDFNEDPLGIRRRRS